MRGLARPLRPEAHRQPPHTGIPYPGAGEAPPGSADDQERALRLQLAILLPICPQDCPPLIDALIALANRKSGSREAA